MYDQQLLGKGAEVVAGYVYLDRKLVGIYGPTGFVLTAEGEAALAIEDVVYRELPPAVAPEEIPLPPVVEEPPAPAPRPAAKRAAKHVPAPADPTDELLDGLDKLGL